VRGGHLGEVQTEIGHRPDHRHRRVQRIVLRNVFEHGPVTLDCLFQLHRAEGGTDAAPCDQIGAGRHRRRRIELQKGQVLDEC